MPDGPAAGVKKERKRAACSAGVEVPGGMWPAEGWRVRVGFTSVDTFFFCNSCVNSCSQHRPFQTRQRGSKWSARLGGRLPVGMCHAQVTVEG